jgi:molybdopterin molybdotransferase
MTPLEAAQELVLRSCPPASPARIGRHEAGGLVLAADVASVPVVLTVVGELAAGVAPSREVGPGEAIRIMTGAPVPAGADAIVMVEDSERVGDDQVRLSASVEPGTSIRRAGDDVRIGDVLFEAGTVVSPAVEGVLASVNVTHVVVHPRPRVAVLSTGDELIDDGSPLAPGQIRESNKTMLANLLAAAGCEVVDLGIVRDDEAALERVLRDAAAGCDAIVSSGGVSMGDYDVVKAVLGRIADMTWMQVAIRPAKPFAFGLLEGVPVFGLPGNPVSSLVSFELFARPALRQMLGHRRLMRTGVVAVSDVALRRHPDGKTHFVRVNGAFGDDGRYHVRPVAAQGSHQLAATALADAMAVVPDGEGVPEGGDVAVLLLHDLA